MKCCPNRVDATALFICFYSLFDDCDYLCHGLLCCIDSTSILNDVVLNKRTTITDEEALKDAKRSLKAMLNDFLTQHW